MVNLFSLTGLSHELNIDPSDSPIEVLKKFNDVAQRNFLRAPGSERWDLKDSDFLKQNRPVILSSLRDLGFTEELKPKYDSYDYVLLLGALEKRVQIRRLHLQTLIKEGVIEVKHVSLLGGQRSLKKDLEPSSLASSSWLNKVPETEMDMMIHDYLGALNEDSDLGNALKNISWDTIDVPMQIDEEGKLRRPNTRDTILEFQRKHPIPGRVLVISNQPYCPYQDAVVRAVLPKSYVIDTVGLKAGDNMLLSDALDSVARSIFEVYCGYKNLLEKKENEQSALGSALIFSNKELASRGFRDEKSRDEKSKVRNTFKK